MIKQSLRRNFIWNLESLEAPKLLLEKVGGKLALPCSPPEENIELLSQIANNDIEENTSLNFYKWTGQAIDASKFCWREIKDINELAYDHGPYLCQAIATLWPHMPKYEKDLSIIKLPQFLYKADHTKEVIFFGGSFNPWHEGHRACVDLSPHSNIIIVPDFNPWKSYNQEGVSKSCRWKSFKQLADGLSSTQYSLYPGFWGIKTPNPTSTWIPKTQYIARALLLGDDSFFSFSKWKDPQILINNLDSIYVTPRNYSLEEISMKHQEYKKTFPDSNFVILDEHDFQALSSTQIREQKN